MVHVLRPCPASYRPACGVHVTILLLRVDFCDILLLVAAEVSVAVTVAAAVVRRIRSGSIRMLT